jgi:YD repeat-containing protein
VDNPHYEVYGYNDRNELQTSDYYTGTYPSGTNVPAKDFIYAYDPIGNRTEYTPGQSPATTYTTNERNQYTATANPTESFGYDFDGNLKTIDAAGTANDWTYTWDAENRLVEAVKTTPSYGAQKVQFAYDYLGRRVEKKVYVYVSYGFALAPPAWYLYMHRKFVWDGWKLLEELNGKSSDAVVRKYTWGLDLAGLSGSINSLESAGGIAGVCPSTTPARARSWGGASNGGVPTGTARASGGSRTPARARTSA